MKVSTCTCVSLGGFALLVGALGSSCRAIDPITHCEDDRTCNEPSVHSDPSGGTGGLGTGGTAADDPDGGALEGGTGGTASEAGTVDTGGTAAGGGSGGGTTVVTPPCDPTLSPADDTCVVTEKLGVFVSAAGDDATGSGTREKPFRSLSHAIAEAPGKRVYACAGAAPYSEPLTLSLTQAQNGLQIFGGFDCDHWTYSPERKSSLVAGRPNALDLNGVTDLLLADFSVQAADATTPGESSLAVIARGGTSAVFRRVAITAGKGADGLAGQDGTRGANGADAGNAQKGMDAVCPTDATAQLNGGTWDDPSPCGSWGGTGGASRKSSAFTGYPGIAGTWSIDGAPVTPVDNKGDGAAGAAEDGKDGGPGNNGKPGTPGRPAAPIGTFTEIAFQPAGGNAGTDGGPGQGGGGGGASKGTGTCIGASGGAGGMGGCGSTKGGGGGGGGASVALLIWGSSIKLDGCQLQANSGGKGGNGGNALSGGNGKQGGAGGGFGTGIGNGGSGGKGGNGGAGGPGSGGSGGPSYALAVKAGSSIEGEETCQLSSSPSPAAPGIGGTAPGATDVPAGSAGPSEPRAALP